MNLKTPPKPQVPFSSSPDVNPASHNAPSLFWPLTPGNKRLQVILATLLAIGALVSNMALASMVKRAQDGGDQHVGNPKAILSKRCARRSTARVLRALWYHWVLRVLISRFAICSLSAFQCFRLVCRTWVWLRKVRLFFDVISCACHILKHLDRRLFQEACSMVTVVMRSMAVFTMMVICAQDHQSRDEESERIANEHAQVGEHWASLALGS